jgi:hypothetical protein
MKVMLAKAVESVDIFVEGVDMFCSCSERLSTPDSIPSRRLHNVVQNMYVPAVRFCLIFKKLTGFHFMTAAALPIAYCK